MLVLGVFLIFDRAFEVVGIEHSERLFLHCHPRLDLSTEGVGHHGRALNAGVLPDGRQDVVDVAEVESEALYQLVHSQY